MKHLFGILVILSIVILVSSSRVALAKDGQGGGDRDRRERAEIKIENENENENEATEEANENEFEVRQVLPQRVEVENQEFEVRGTISSISGNSFVISGQTVVIDASRVRKFEQRGNLQVGSFVRVEGVIINGTKFASKIRVISVNNPEATPSSSLQPTSTPVSSPSATKVDLRLEGVSGDVNSFLNQILALVRNLLARA